MIRQIVNDFHGTSVRIRVPVNGILTVHQTKKVMRELCGMADCHCGKIRGPQTVQIEWHDQDRLKIGK